MLKRSWYEPNECSCYAVQLTIIVTEFIDECQNISCNQQIFT